MDEDFLFSALVQGRESSISFHSEDKSVVLFGFFCPPVMICMSLLCNFGQPAGIAFGGCGPCCCSIFHCRADIACVDVSTDIAADS